MSLSIRERIIAVQTARGLKPDGIAGQLTWREIYSVIVGPEPIIKRLPSLLPWTAEVDGDDLVIRNVMATCFGGAYDKLDNGETESGLMNDGSDPKLFGVALPIRSNEAATRNSPIAFKGEHIPWETYVFVWNETDGPDKGCEAKLIDNGPDVLKHPTHAFDVNPPVARHFNPEMSLQTVANSWQRKGMSCRIIGAARYIS